MKISYDKLWKLLIDKKINKTQLIKMADISTNSMAKLGKNETVQVEILVKICNVLNCNIEDIMEIIRNKDLWKAILLELIAKVGGNDEKI